MIRPENEKNLPLIVTEIQENVLKRYSQKSLFLSVPFGYSG